MINFLRQAEFGKAFLIGLAIVVIYSFILVPLGWFDVAKLKAQDLFYNITRQFRPAPKELQDIVFISIDDESFKNLNKKWPWSRDIIAQMLETLADYHSLVVCLDFVFLGESENKEHDIMLERALENAGNVLLSSYYGKKGEYMPAHRRFSQAALASGIINIPKDKDSLIRNTRPVILSADRQALNYSIGVKAACRYFGFPLENISYDGEQIIFQRTQRAKPPALDIRIPVRKDGTMPLNYGVNPRQLRTVPFWKVYRKAVPQDVFERKIVLVGRTSEIFHDIHNTPLGRLPGTVIMAYDILMLISGDFIKETGRTLELVTLFLFALIATATAYSLSSFKGLASAVLEIVAFAGAGIIMSLNNRWWDFFSVAFIVALIYIVINFYKYIRLLIESAKLKTLAITDELTGLFTYRYLQIRLQNEFERVSRYGNELSLIMLDIDHFKQLNDTYGHQQGNAVLKQVAETVQDSTRKADVTFRYGGEEFCVILTQTNRSGAFKYAQRLRKTIENREIHLSSGVSLRVSVSVGVAGATPDVKSANQLLERADQALYRAKTTGRNKVCAFLEQKKGSSD